MSATHVAFDWRALVDPVDRQAARAFEKALRAQGRAPSGSGVVVAIVAVVVVGVLLVVFGVFAGAVVAMLTGGLGAILGVVPVMLIGGLLVLGIVLVFRSQHARAERWLRLDRFAAANGMSFVPSLPAPHLPGMIFGRGDSREATDLVRGAQPRFVEFGNYRFTTGSGKNRVTHRWGYVAVKLDVPLPHIILDATGNNGLLGSNLPRVFHKDQRLSLEGDFDRYFSLYCPTGYEADALYLFTPDIMARFIDNAAQLDVEIVDDWLFLYAKRDLSTLDPATWGWLFTAVAALLDKFAQWSRWRDDRLAAVAPAAPMAGAVASGIPGAQPATPLPMITPPPGVAPQGRRLKGGVPWVAIIIFGGIGLVWALGYLGAGMGLFFGR